MTKDFRGKDATKNILEEDDTEIREIYGCNDNPLGYMIEPKGSIDIIGKDEVTTKEDLEDIL